MVDPLLTVEDVAAQLGVSKKTVYRILEEGRIEYARIGGARRFRQEAVDAYVESVTVPASRRTGRGAKGGLTQ